MWITVLYSELYKICKESYQNMNPKKDIVFPYLTYSVHHTPGDVGESGAYVDIEIFDNKGADRLGLEVLAQKVSDHFERGLFKNDKYLIQSEFISNRHIPTDSTVVSRRLVQIKVKISRRE